MNSAKYESLHYRLQELKLKISILHGCLETSFVDRRLSFLKTPENKWMVM